MKRNRYFTLSSLEHIIPKLPEDRFERNPMYSVMSAFNAWETSVIRSVSRFCQVPAREAHVVLNCYRTSKDNLVLEWWPADGNPYPGQGGENRQFGYFSDRHLAGYEPDNRLLQLSLFQLSAYNRGHSIGQPQYQEAYEEALSWTVSGLAELCDLAEEALELVGYNVTWDQAFFLEGNYDSYKYKLADYDDETAIRAEAKEEREFNAPFAGLGITKEQFLTEFAKRKGVLKRTAMFLPCEISSTRVKKLALAIYEMESDLYDKFCDFKPRGSEEIDARVAANEAKVVSLASRRE